MDAFPLVYGKDVPLNLNFNVTVMNLIVLSFLNLGGYEIVLIFFVILLLFGGKKIPELARGLGKGIKEFNSARASIETEIKEGMKEADRKRIEETKEVEETK